MKFSTIRGNVFPVFMIMVTCAGCKEAPQAGWIDSERLAVADSEAENWMSLGRNSYQHHHSPLEAISLSNVADLGFAWEYDASSRIGRVSRGLEATPIVVDGVMYTSGAWGVVYALDAATGAEKWRYDPPVDATYDRRACCDVVNRGVQVWKGRVYVATIDGFLVALDAATGKVVWKVDTLTDRSRYYTITGPPQVAKGVVVIGNSGAEYGVRGYITAYDLETGEEAWRFFIVPGDPKNGYEHPEMEMAAETWDPDSHWESGGGGTVWGELAYDSDLDLLYVGTGNSSPYPAWIRSPQGGDNLFLASILAIRPDDGRLVWHYQTTPAEIWDYTATQNIILADVEIDGRERKVLMQAPKNGFFYVLDRTTGELLSAEKYTYANWASHVDMETGRPVVTAEGNYQDGSKELCPWDLGGHNWKPMRYSPQTGLVYIPVIEGCNTWSAEEDYEYRPGRWNMGIVYESWALKSEMLKAWDPLAQEEVWSVPLIGASNGGVLSTNGKLVFQGTATGYFVAYHAETGEKLTEIKIGTSIMAAPITYAVDGVQYVSVMAGLGGALSDSFPKDNAAAHYVNRGRIVTFKLGGGTVPLPPEREIQIVPEPPERVSTLDARARGEEIYLELCAGCHGWMNKSFSLYPDLTALGPEVHEIFDDIVLGGIYSANGMSSFADVLSAEDVDSIHSHLISLQRDRFENQTE